MRAASAIGLSLSLAMTAAACGGAPEGSPGDPCAKAPGDHPVDLACTGLYADFSTGTTASNVESFEPGVELWSDGAEKRRFIRLPEGAVIDTHDMDHWVFPAGTKLWKEFSMGGLRVETRYLEKRGDGRWFRTTYAWSRDQKTATENTGGVRNVWGTGSDIPAQSECASCHDGAPDGVLGFEAIGLSMIATSGLTMKELVARRLVSDAPGAVLSVPGTPTEVAALGWLHANCGNACHNRSAGAEARGTGLFLRLSVSNLGDTRETDAFVTAVGVPSGFQPAQGAGFLRIKPGDVSHSAIPFRDLARDDATRSGLQMPPIATHLPDLSGVARVEAWINAM